DFIVHLGPEPGDHAPAIVSQPVTIVEAEPPANVSLRFDSLPSAQGWRYATGAGTPETSAFSADGTTLHQDTLPFPDGGGASVYHEYRLVSAPNAPADLYVDGVLVGHPASFINPGNSPSAIEFGDFSGDTNARADVTALRLFQPPSSPPPPYRYDVDAVDPDDD